MHCVSKYKQNAPNIIKPKLFVCCILLKLKFEISRNEMFIEYNIECDLENRIEMHRLTPFLMQKPYLPYTVMFIESMGFLFVL